MAYEQIATITDVNAKYTKPSTGIPSTDLASAVQTSLDKADSALQTHQDISGKQNVPSQVTTGTSITLADNTEYRLTDVTTLTIAYPSGNFECWMRIATASSGTVTITLPSSTYIGEAPSFDNGTTYELSIKDGVVVCAEVGDGT